MINDDRLLAIGSFGRPGIHIFCQRKCGGAVTIGRRAVSVFYFIISYMYIYDFFRYPTTDEKMQLPIVMAQCKFRARDEYFDSKVSSIIIYNNFKI